MRALIAVLPGDGVGPELATEGVRLLEAVAKRYGHTLDLEVGAIGGQAIDRAGTPLPEATTALCLRAAAVLLGAVGGAKWDDLQGTQRPEAGKRGLESALGLYANIRPVAPYSKVAHASPLRRHLLEKVDLVVVRALRGDATSEPEVERLMRFALGMARTRRKRLTSVDDGDVLPTSQLWHDVAARVAKDEFPDVAFSHEVAPAAVVHLVKKPADYDVLVADGAVGAILSDEASVLAGASGMVPSMSVGKGRRGLYELVHGSAHGDAERGVANPYGTILSVAMLLRQSLGLEEEAKAIERAVAWAIGRGLLTVDVAAEKPLKTWEVTTAVIDAVVRGGGGGR